MADETGNKAIKPADPLADVEDTGNSEPATPASVYDDPEKEIRKEDDSDEHQVEREELKHTQSRATDTSTITRTTTRTSVPAKKLWYKKINPLLWGPVPPVPQEREVSREYGAGFFSRLTFQWMAPLMSVSVVPVRIGPIVLIENIGRV